MELANNQLADAEWQAILPQIRQATRGDEAGIMRLLETAVYRHAHPDWYLPGDWLGSAGFVLLPQTAVDNPVTRLFSRTDELLACLAVGVDVEPVAWVRVAALQATGKAAGNMLAAMLSRVEPHLQAKGVQQLAWLMSEPWPTNWLEATGFFVGNHIETYIREETAVPEPVHIPDLTIRPATPADYEPLAALEQTAFQPLWQHSSYALQLAAHYAFSYDVAFLGETAVGFQISTRSSFGVHLVRLTVDAAYHGRGIGSALLAHALQGYHQAGLHVASLNTQVDNIASQRLYGKFGFEANGQRLPIWFKEYR